MTRLLLMVLPWLALGGVAGANVECLTDGYVLTDQRALAALRVATEAACPCASYTATPGHDRGAYRACTRTTLDAALTATTLRRECKSTANRTNSKAVCGTSKIACGRFTPTAAKSRTCRVKPATRCASTAGFTERACTAQTHCADVVDWTASTCTDVRAAGPFVPGVRILSLTKQSVVNPADPRVLDTVVWYPAPAGSGPLDPAYGAVLNAPLDPSAGPYPLIVFSHGSCGIPTQSTFLWPQIASHGFVVAAPPHPGNTLNEFPACGTFQAQVASALERPADVIFVLDQMLAADQNPLSPFSGAIDEARVGMAGHSFGGFTTYLAVTQDARFKVALPMAPAIPASQPVLTIPSLTMLGQVDTYVSNPAIRDAYARAQSPKYLVEIQAAGHFAFSNNCFPSPDCNPPTTLTQDEAHDAVRRWVLGFLEHHLAGDASFAPFLVPPAPPGFVFQAAP